MHSEIYMLIANKLVVENTVQFTDCTVTKHFVACNSGNVTRSNVQLILLLTWNIQMIFMHNRHICFRLFRDYY